MTGDDRIPDLRVNIDGSDLSAQLYDDLLEVIVDDDAELPSMATLRLIGSAENDSERSILDDERFSPGRPITIELGYAGSQLSAVFSGEITGFEVELGQGEVPTFTVRAYDLRHRLLRGSSTRAFVDHTDSQIAEQLAKANQLKAQVTDSRVKHAYVLQAEETDLDFLKRRAALVGFEVAMDGDVLLFRPRDEGQEATLSLSTAEDILDIHARLSASSLVGGVRVSAWDAAKKEAFEGTARAGDEPSMGDTPGSKAADQAFGAAVLTITNSPNGSQEEADAIARASLASLSLGYITAEGTCIGNSAVRVGTTVSLQGLGKRLSGAYYVAKATHRSSPKTGYRTRFSARRNAT